MRFRPRFTVRTLAIFVTLACAYFGAWGATKRYATFDHKAYTTDGHPVAINSLGGITIARGKVTVIVEDIRWPAPFVMIQDEEVNDATDRKFDQFWMRSTYYIWLFGPKFKLPFESKWE